MKTIALLLLLCAPAFAEKMAVKVIAHSIDGKEYTRIVPGFAAGDGNALANSYSTSSVYAPAQAVQDSPTDIVMTLLLPDGRKIFVGCEVHFSGLSKTNRHNCKNPTADTLEADFSRDNVKLRWAADIDGKKKDSETFTILKILPAPTSPATP
jgi:hypothetical protein